ncbi:hypothetical protein ACFPOU_16055 [Massilia jejuensis]|uniref:MerR-like DNA binding protein n=1 Tax=Massilia jejuensis TaxID=648894 RepID=A0ABW0PJI1_9BURK
MVLDQNGCCRKTHDAAVAKLATVEADIKHLNKIRTTLNTLIEECESGGADLSCPIIETLRGGIASNAEVATSYLLSRC